MKVTICLLEIAFGRGVVEGGGFPHTFSIALYSAAAAKLGSGSHDLHDDQAHEKSQDALRWGS